jgi:hypothetical protein
LWKCAIAAALLLGAVDLPITAQSTATPEVPTNFKLDLETAARLRPQLMEASVPAKGRYGTGQLVFERVIQQAEPASGIRPSWQMRIVENGQLNAYASPDGTVYVESGLASIAGQSTGLWAAILTHEIAHVLRRDWARRYLYQKQVESGSAATIVLGDPGLPGGSWTDSSKASADLGQFCRQLEVEADRGGLMLMAKAGYHPDFVAALHHLLHAEGVAGSASLYSMHPCWEERDHELSQAYTEASIDFAHRWPEWYASPGGNPPVVVFADPPTVKKTSSREWQIQIPMRCQNLAGAVEVVLIADPKHDETIGVRQLSHAEQFAGEERQLTGCTSPKTTVVFNLADMPRNKSDTRWTDVYVIDAWGSVLARADLPKLPR